ncbi:hypothetical protein [Pseudoprimorskyibacter insulae]|nr:hypothetical protein [Pseudoprimorskyibacter insulae]
MTFYIGAQGRHAKAHAAAFRRVTPGQTKTGGAMLHPRVPTTKGLSQ